ncbi:MAG: ABC transporter ATP-binding protein [Pseudomonadota bacterium]
MAIELNQVGFAHAQAPETTVLQIAHWQVAAGERVFVHGPSGVGKSTLLNLISGLLVAQEGEVSVLGERLDVMSSRQRDRFRANHIGYVFQRFNLIPYLNAIENIALAGSFSAGTSRQNNAPRPESLLESLNLETSSWRKPTAVLSMGQQQRVAIARALINQPELLIADEPTSSLDQDNRDKFLALLMPLVEEHNMTLLFASHDMTLAKHFSKIQPFAEISQDASA